MPLFDVYLTVDWSAANGLRPKHPVKDAVWIGEYVRENRTRETYHHKTDHRETCHRSRKEAIDYLTSRLFHHLGAERKVLAGFDFSFSFPTGFARGSGLMESGRPPSEPKDGGAPYLYRLRYVPRLESVSRVWPGVVRERTRTLLRDEPSLIRDQAQVRSLCRWMAELDSQGRLSAMFDTPSGLKTAAAKVCIEEEGWALGAR